MPLWIVITIIAHLANAIVFLVDKMLLGSSAKPQPVAYMFYSAVLGLFALVLLPFGGWQLPDMNGVLLGFAAGAPWIFALLFFFHALREGEASRIAPVVGGFVPFFTLLFAFFFLGQSLSTVELIAFMLLAGGGIVMTARRHQGTLSLHLLEVSIAAGAFFAISFLMSDLLFDRYPFAAGLIWTRIAGLLVALFFLIPGSTRRSIFNTKKRSSQRHTLIFLGNKGLAGLTLIGITYAIALGNVSLVNALQGVQYVFLFFIALLLSWKFPHLLEEDRRGIVLFQKIVGIAIIGIGLFLLA